MHTLMLEHCAGTAHTCAAKHWMSATPPALIRVDTTDNRYSASCIVGQEEKKDYENLIVAE